MTRRGLSAASGVGVLAACGVLAPGDWALSDPGSVFFSGCAFLTRYADIAQTFPRLSAFLEAEGASTLDHTLVWAGRSGSETRPLRVEFDALGRLGPGLDANVLALTFERELVLTSRIGSTWKLLVELSLQALVFDFSSRMIRASFPLTLQYIDAFDTEPSRQDIDVILKRLVFGSQPTGLAATFWKALDRAVLPEPGARTLRVTRVEISDAASRSLADLGIVSTAPLTDQLGHDFGTFLSSNQHLSVLPYASSQALNGKMAARLSNGTAFDLVIPAPDYEISLRLDGLKKVMSNTTAAGTVWVYGAFVTIAVIEPLSGRSYFDGQVKLGATRTLPATAQPSDDDWPSYSEVLRQLFDQFTRALTGPDRDWCARHLVGAADLQPLKDLIAQCR